MAFDRSISLGGMQRQLCTVFAKPWPKTQVGILVGDIAFHEFSQQPLLLFDGSEVTVVFSLASDLRFVDQCFRGRRPTFEEDMANEF